MNILAFESSGTAASVAVLQNDKVLCEIYADVGLTHSQTLMPIASECMKKANLLPSELNAMAVDVGPGSFTGIRIGVCSANAMGHALDIPVIGIDSLKIIANNVVCQNKTACVIIDARGVQIYGAAYNFKCGKITETVLPIACTIEEYLQKLGNTDLLFAGDGAIAHKELILQHFGENAQFAPLHSSRLNAASLGAIAYEKLTLGENTKFTSPFYMRVPQAQRAKG